MIHGGCKFSIPSLSRWFSRIILSERARTYGELRVEIVKRPDDANPAVRMGEVVPGYSFDDCDLIRSNCPNQIVTWNKNDDISFLYGQPVYLRFRMAHRVLAW